MTTAAGNLPRVLAALLLAVPWVVASAGPVRAQEGGCPASFLPLAPVEITSPERGATVSGTVRVTGKVSAAVALNRVELYVGGKQVATGPLDGRTSPQVFTLVWDASAAPTGATSLRVVACGNDGAVIPQLLAGEATTEVKVAVPPPASVVSSSTSAPPTTRAGEPAPATTRVPASPADTRAAAGVAASDATTTVPPATTTTARSQPTEAPVPATVADGKVQPAGAGPAGPSRPGALTLTQGDGDDGPGPPIWVGVVVGVSGTIGLLVSALFRRSHAAPDDDEEDGDYELDELDSDLVQV